jgi:trigger factor
MNITIDRQLNCLATLHVEIPAAIVSAEKVTILKQYAKQAKIPGFRPGKAPMAVIEKRFQNDIKEEVESRLINQSLQESLKTEQLKVLDFGTPSNMSYPADGSFRYETILTLAPEIVLPDYKGLTVSVPSGDVGKTEIDAQLDNLRQRFADFSDVDGRALEMGDFAIIDYTSTVEGAPLEEALGRPAGYLAGRESYWLKMHDEAFLPGFATQLVGAHPGEARDVEIAIPEDFPVVDLREKKLLFHTQIKELKKQELPDLDDAFAARLMGEGKTLEDLNITIVEGLKANKKKEIDDMKINQIIAHFDQLIEFEVPEQLLDAETQNQADALVESAVKSGMSEEEIQQQRESLIDTAAAQARTNIKTNFILQEIATKEKIVVQDQELIQHLIQIANNRKEEPEKFIKGLSRNGQIPGIRNSLLINKALDFLLEHASVSETSPEPNTITE